VTRVMKARKTSRCPACRAAMTVGQLIAQPSPDAPWQHARCLIASRALPPRGYPSVQMDESSQVKRGVYALD